MKCPRCQAENDAGARFCEDCGARLEVACPSCGTPVTPGKKFCRSCGAALTAEAAGRFASPESYTPKHLAEKILTSRAALEGERKQVTVLFADLKGSMELLGDRDPEEARKLLDPVLEHMMEAVHRYEGTVNQVMGDGIMALFGAPLAHEDHAVRACYAALWMQEAVKRHAGDVRRTTGMPLAIRVGLNSGEVVVRSIGSDLHMDYTAVGQTTHVAARMEQAALPGSIVISPDTLRLAEGLVEVKPLGPTQVKGLPEPMEVYELAGGGPARTRFQAAATRGLTRFVGRDAEVEQLRHLLERAAAGHGQVVAIVGEAGVGKTRLFHEFTHSHRVHGCLFLQAGSVPYGRATAYLPVIDLLRGYFMVQDRDGPRETRDKVIGRVLGVDRSLEGLLPPLLALLEVPVDDPRWDALDPSQRRQRTLEAVRRLLLRESQAQPLLLVIEDLHWIDSETQAFLDNLIDRLGSNRVLLLVSYRPEYEHRWGKRTYYTQLRLERLPPESTSELLHALLGAAPGLEPLKQMLRRRGNPFFLEETVRTLVEARALDGKRGAYWLVRPVQSLQIPATVQAILAARIDRLPPEEKQLLQAASVIGKDVPHAILAPIAGLPAEALHRGLGHLQEAEFLYETGLFPDLEYTFKHALTNEVTYGSLLQDRRRTLHRRIVDILEGLYPDRLAEQVERLAHHAFRGELWDRAADYLRRAGIKAVGRCANREALSSFENAVLALQRLPESRDTLEQMIDLHFEIRNSLFAIGEHGPILENLRLAETLARKVNDQRRLGWVTTYMSQHFWREGDVGRAVELGQEALAIASGLGDVPLEALAHFRLGQAYQRRGNLRLAIGHTGKSIAALHGELLYARFGLAGLPSVFARGFLAWSAAELGEFAKGLARAEEAIQIAEVANQPYSMVHATFTQGFLHLRKGTLDHAIAVLERNLALCRNANIPALLPYSLSALGYAYALAGRVAEGLPLVEESVKPSVLAKGAHLFPLVLLAETYLFDEQLERARGAASEALARCRAVPERTAVAWILSVLGEVAARSDPSDLPTAHARYKEALTLARKLSMRPLVAHCHFGLGRLYRRTGRLQEAQEYLSTATTMYREMDMRFYLGKAEAEMKELA